MLALRMPSSRPVEELSVPAAGCGARFDRWLPAWLLWVAAFALLSLQLVAFSHVRSDDAYITYRYGQNLATGFGLVFNPGQRVQGSTSPGQMLLAALVYKLFGLARTPTAMAAIGCVAWSAQVVAVYRLLAKPLGRLAAAALALGVALGVAGAAAWVPLETNWVAAFVLFGCVFAQQQRWSSAAFSCGLAVLIRPDACLAALVLGASCAWQQRTRAWRPACVFLAIVLPWQLFAHWYYGSALPQSAITKFQRVGFADYLLHELDYPSIRWLWPGADVSRQLVALALAASGAWRLMRRREALMALVIYGVLHAAAYLVLRPFTEHAWHLYPWTLVFCICAWAALAPDSENQARPALRVAKLIALLLVLSFSVVHFVGDCRTLARGYWTGQRDLVYQRIAAYLHDHARPGEWFASVEVGTLAYYSGLPAYDLGGLVTRQDDPMRDHPVRFIVLDKAYLAMAPTLPPVFSAQQGNFVAYVYELPQRN
jgi:arabinofuranosyltransferase